MEKAKCEYYIRLCAQHHEATVVGGNGDGKADIAQHKTRGKKYDIIVVFVRHRLYPAVKKRDYHTLVTPASLGFPIQAPFLSRSQITICRDPTMSTECAQSLRSPSLSLTSLLVT